MHSAFRATEPLSSPHCLYSVQDVSPLPSKFLFWLKLAKVSLQPRLNKIPACVFKLVQLFLSSTTTAVRIGFLYLGNFCWCAWLISAHRVWSSSGCRIIFCPSADTMQHLAVLARRSTWQPLADHSVFSCLSPVAAHHPQHLHRGVRENTSLHLLLRSSPCSSEKRPRRGKSESCWYRGFSL